MSNNTRFVILAFLTAFFCVSAAAQTPAAGSGPAGPNIMRLADVREGQHGIAKSVFHGTQPEEFNIEILGIVPDSIGPHQDLIIGKLSGANAERTFVFAGMSGSPVYIDGKLVGAVSYSFPFSKEPICGITPIEQMISIFEQSPAPRPIAGTARVFTLGELSATRLTPADATSATNGVLTGMPMTSALTQVAGQTFRPIATPMTFSGISQATLNMFAPEFQRRGIIPMLAAGGASPITPLGSVNENTLRGGDSIVVHLARGDVAISAAGTVTLRDGDRIYAFGHQYFSLGVTNLPMSESHVITVVPNVNNSFKLTVPDAMVGTLTQDRATGIYGILGEAPKMLPVTVHLTTSRGKVEDLNFETAIDEFLTPIIINVGLQNSITANERGLGDSTIDLNGEIRIEGEKSILIHRRFSGSQASASAAATPAVPLALLLKADFPGLRIVGLNVDLKVTDGSKTATLERITTDRTQVRPGDTIALTAYSRSDDGKLLVQQVPLKVPQDAAPGPISVTIGDGGTLQQASSAQQFVAKSAAELIDIMNKMKRPDRLYALATRTSAGAIVGASEMPDLPPSVLATINNDRSAGGTKPSVQTVLADNEIDPIDYIVSGQQTLTLEIVR